jgi:amidase
MARLDLDPHALKQAWFDVSSVGVAQWIDGFVRAQGIPDPEERMERVNLGWIEAGRRVSGTQYLTAVQCLHRSSRAMGRFFLDHDILLSPATAEVAPLVGELAGRDQPVDQFYDRFWQHAPFTPVFNASGCPAMSVPLHWTHDNLPVGVQFGAAFGEDGLLLQLARQLEKASPWAHRRPG